MSMVSILIDLLERLLKTLDTHIALWLLTDWLGAAA